MKSSALETEIGENHDVFEKAAPSALSIFSLVIQLYILRRFLEGFRRYLRLYISIVSAGSWMTRDYFLMCFLQNKNMFSPRIIEQTAQACF